MHMFYVYTCTKCYSGKSLISSPLLRKYSQYFIYWLAQYKCSHLAVEITTLNVNLGRVVHIWPHEIHTGEPTFPLYFFWRFCLQPISLRNVLTPPFTKPQCKEDRHLLYKKVVAFSKLSVCELCQKSTGQNSTSLCKHYDVHVDLCAINNGMFLKKI